MRLHWRSAASVSRLGLEDYVRSYRVDARCWDEHVLQEHTVAHLGVDHILQGDAVDDGESLFAICDNGSDGLHHLHVILTEGTNEIRDDLGVEEPVDAVVFVHAAVFHPVAQPYRVSILDAVFKLFGSLSLAVMWREVGDVPEAEQVQLGLARVAGRQLVFRHNARATPYGDAHPRGMGIDIVGSKAVHRWVRDEWERLYGS